MNSRVIDLADEVATLEDDIEEVLDEAEELDDDSEEYDEKEVQYKALCVQKDKYEDILDGEDSLKFEIREMSFGEVMRIRDETMAKSPSPENPREGYYKIQVLEHAVEESPVGMDGGPEEWPPALAEWVYDEIEQMNAGISEDSLGNLSLDRALEERTQ